MNGRIFFEGNPWPEGHPIKTFEWSARMVDDVVWYDLHLETVDYNAEHDPEIIGDATVETDWQSPGVWNNFHACKLSSKYWPGEATGFRAGTLEQLERSLRSEARFRIDLLNEYDWDTPAFNTYLLGHDAVADHEIVFTPSETSGSFDVDWTGKIALAYVGEEIFKYKFRAGIKSVKPPDYPI